MKPETILPHSGRAARGDTRPPNRVVYAPAQREIMSKNETMEHGQDARAIPFYKTRCCGRGRPHSRLSAPLVIRNAWPSHTLSL